MKPASEIARLVNDLMSSIEKTFFFTQTRTCAILVTRLQLSNHTDDPSFRIILFNSIFEEEYKRDRNLYIFKGSSAWESRELRLNDSYGWYYTSIVSAMIILSNWF